MRGAIGVDLLGPASQTMSSSGRKLARLRLAVAESLQSSYPTRTIPEAIEAAVRVEQSLPDVVRQAVVSLGSGNPVAAENQLLFDKASYSVVVQPSVAAPRTLEIGVTPIGKEIPRSRLRKLETRVKSNGLCERVEIWLPPSLQALGDEIVVSTQSVIETSARWVEERIMLLVESATKEIGGELYAHLYTVVPERELLEDVWFAAGNRDRAFYLLDSLAASHALSLLNSYRRGPGLTPLRLLGEFVGADVPLEQSFARIAVGDVRCVEFDLGDAKYRDSLSALQAAELGVYRSQSISILPVCKTDRSYLILVFPTKNKQRLLPTLEENREYLAQRFLLAESNLKSILKLIRKPQTSIHFGKAGEFVGGFVKSWLDP